MFQSAICNPSLPSVSAGCDKPRFNEERRVSEDTVGKTIKETDSSVMEEVGEVELQVSRGWLVGDKSPANLILCSSCMHA